MPIACHVDKPLIETRYLRFHTLFQILPAYQALVWHSAQAFRGHNRQPCTLTDLRQHVTICHIVGFVEQMPPCF
jgi:hypothetical protein